MNLKTDIEIGKEKKKQMLKALTTSLIISRSFEELINNMKKLGYRVTLSQNEKIGISGMRIVKFEDINHQTEREYKPGYKLSEITNTLKIKDIKQKLQENNERTIVFSFLIVRLLVMKCRWALIILLLYFQTVYSQMTSFLVHLYCFVLLLLS